MPDMVLLNEFGSGVDADGNVIEEDPEGSLLDTPVEGAEELEADPEVQPRVTTKREKANGEEKISVEAEPGGKEDVVDSGETEVGVFDENGQEVDPADVGGDE
jgi:hypothetical protein